LTLSEVIWTPFKETRRSRLLGNLIFAGPEFGNILSGVFTPVLAKHSKSFSLIACISVGVDRMQRNFEPMYEEFRPRTIWSLSNAFTSAFKELDPVPPFKATAKLGEFLEARFSQSF
jgi:hypothetical protein